MSKRDPSEPKLFLGSELEPPPREGSEPTEPTEPKIQEKTLVEVSGTTINGHSVDPPGRPEDDQGSFHSSSSPGISTRLITPT
ncbi:MAG: hypothetical protein HC924_17850 [Synechococcaceae cyanobacterium SM2_3_2]|nr:hypothetical protein [Synechococcaceae cyanobacterium SM2_3_2]